MLTATFLRCITMSSAACPALPCFSTLSHKRHDFRKKVIEHKMLVLITSTIFVWNFSNKKNSVRRYNKRAVQYSTYIGLLVKRPLFLSDCNDTWSFSTDFRKIHKHEISLNLSSRIQVVPCGRTQTDRRAGGHTDMTKLIMAFPNFANAPTKW